MFVHEAKEKIVTLRRHASPSFAPRNRPGLPSASATLRLVAVRPRPGDARQGWLRAGERILPCALGRGGVRVRKREGDGATPTGTFTFREAFAPREPLAGVPVRQAALPFRTVGARDGWCDASDDRNYNRAVSLPYGAGHERLVRDDHLYDMVLVPDHNRAGLGRGLRARGSAVFVHLARPGYTPTEGCVALSRAHMLWLWPRIGSRTRLRITL